MLSPDVRVEDFDAGDFRALGEILQGGSAPGAGGLVLLVEGERVHKLLSTVRGRLPLPSGRVPLEELCRDHGARWAVLAERHALETAAERFAERLERQDNLLRQVLKLAQVLRELSLDGRLEMFPRDPRDWVIPKASTLERAFDVVCPVGKTLLFGAFDGGEVRTSLALRRGPLGFDRIVGPSEVRRELGLVSGDWSRDCRGLARAVELSVGPLALGCFAQTSTWMRLSLSTTPGTFAAALASRDVVLYPLAPAVAIPLGVDLGRAAFVVARDLADRLGLRSRISSTWPLSSALERLRGAAGGLPELERLLGFDPLSLVAEVFGGREEP